MVTSASADQVPYMEEDIAIFNWTLTDHDMAALARRSHILAARHLAGQVYVLE